MRLKKHGITSETIKNMILGAGVIYKNLKYEKASSGWTGTPLGATSGGLKFNYEAQWLGCTDSCCTSVNSGCCSSVWLYP